MPMVEPEIEVGAVGEPGARRCAALPRADRISVRAIAVLSRQARARRLCDAWRGRRARGDSRAAADREGRTARLADARRADRDAPDRRARRDRPHLFDQRHHRDAELHSADRGRRRRLGPHLGAFLRGLGDRAGRTHRLDLQRRAVRRRRGARRLRPARALPHPGRHGKHRAADGGGRSPETDRRRDDAVLRASSRRMGAPARHGSREVERQAGDGRGRARRRRAGDAGEARSRLGRERHRGDGHRRHFHLAVGRMRREGGHAFQRPRLRPYRADRSRRPARRSRSSTAPRASSC